MVPFADGASPSKIIMPNFSIELSLKLSGLIPEFQGHYWYVEDENKNLLVLCEEDIDWQKSGMSITYKNICPAWQVEDVLRNWSKIVAAVKKNPLPEDHINKYGRGTDVIVLTLIQEGDTAYQKIEEYLWSILSSKI